MLEFFNNLKLKLKEKFERLRAFISKIKNISLKKIFSVPKIENGIFNFIAHFWHRIALVIFIFVILYYPLGAMITHKIDDNADYFEKNQTSNGSKTVVTIAALIDREVNQNTWTANLPFFFPSYVLDNMPEYQMGIVSALSRFSMELTDQLGRSRGSSRADVDLEAAAGLLKYSGTTWIIDSSFLPTASANKQYRLAREKLLAYNNRLKNNEAIFEKRADNLQMTLDRIAKDLGSLSEIIDKQINIGENKIIDLQADNVFYSAKGKLYAYYLILRDLGKDFNQIIKDKELETSWERMLLSFKKAALLQPFVVVNSQVDGQFLPSHLASMGFYLLRARTQLNEAGNILLK